MKFLAKKTLAVYCLLIAPQSVFASENLSSANTAWILTSTALVLFMTIPGLSLFYGGLVRVKNVLSVLMQCFAITCMVSILWLIGAYSLAFSEGNALVGGLGNMFFANVTEGSMSGDIPESVFAMFQLTFAIITYAQPLLLRLSCAICMRHPHAPARNTRRGFWQALGGPPCAGSVCAD